MFYNFKSNVHLYNLEFSLRAKGLRYRQENDEVAVCGLFTDLGDLFTVHHMWGKSIYHRVPR